MNGLFRLPAAVRLDPTVDLWLKSQASELGALATTWFARMRECGHDVREVMHDGCPTACVGDSAFGYVGVFKAHMNVGFFRGADLPDPGGLLEGTGKHMRHVKIRPGVDVDAAALAILIGKAYADMKQRLSADQQNDSGASGRRARVRGAAQQGDEADGASRRS